MAYDKIKTKHKKPRLSKNALIKIYLAKKPSRMISHTKLKRVLKKLPKKDISLLVATDVL